MNDFLHDLEHQLKLYSQLKEQHGLLFMDFERYKKQNDFRNLILDRVKTGVGAKIFVCFGGNRSGKTELGASIVAELLESKKQMKLLVTGGTGFVGYNLCKKLIQDGHEVISIDNY